MRDRTDMARGVENLLVGCGGAAPGAEVLIIREAASELHFCPKIADAVADVARDAGYHVAVEEVGFDPDAHELPAALTRRMASADVTLFFARIADQLRFHQFPAGGSNVLSYALDGAALASPFGTSDHRAMMAIKQAVDEALFGAAEIRVTCPQGSDIAGVPPSALSQEVGISRFPMLVARPMPAATFSGLASVGPFLTGTGSHYYDPFTVELSGSLMAEFARGRLVGFHGAAEDVALANSHYDMVAARFGIDRDFVHSWHAGIHPACRFPGPAAADYGRWTGSAFGNPRLLHFHTCGAYAPGEICWNLIDPTVTADGVAIWENGRLRPERLPGAAEILAAHPDIAALYEDPAVEIGI